MKGKPKNKVVTRTVLASTASGFVSGVLAANGTAQQLPDPNSTTNATSVVGDSGTAVTQTGGTAVAGDAGMAKNELYGVAIAGTAGTAVGGAETVSIVHNGGLASTGDGGIAYAKRDGEAVVSGTGIAIAKNFGGKAVVSATDGLLIIGYPNAQGRIKFKVGRIGKNGIKSGVRYTLDKDHKFIEVHAKKRAK